MPAQVDVTITPPAIDVTLAGSTGFHIHFCAKPPSGVRNAKVTIGAAINGVDPESSYSVLNQFENGLAEMTIR